MVAGYWFYYWDKNQMGGPAWLGTKYCYNTVSTKYTTRMEMGIFYDDYAVFGIFKK